MKNQDHLVFTLITGASKGIGMEIAEECARKKMNLILISRSEKELDELAKRLTTTYHIEVRYIIADLSRPEKAQDIYNWCIENNYTINILINNAGIGLFGKFDQVDLDKQLSLIQININSIVQLTYYFLPMLQREKKAYVLNVASIAALYPLPYYSVYGASKAFVLSFTEALGFELRNSSITVSCLCPSDTDTEFFKKAGNLNKKGKLISPKLVAETAINELMLDKSVIFPSNAKRISRTPRFILKKLIAKRISSYNNVKR